ncbi:MAG TPA: DUF4097 family beta strand repeat-containing protein [Edaphobacter sp.]|nr:DUF4097 family beta strand repeat-containing protein [Edaphobacter sp.]
MATNPPPYPPPPQNDWRYQRRVLKEQARIQRDMLRAQAEAYRYRARRFRHGSIIGPLIVIAVGIVFLLIQTGRLSGHQVWRWYGNWWPVLLIGLGVVMFLEWIFDRYLHHDAQPVYRRTMGGGVFSLLVLLVLVGIVFSGLRGGNGTFFGHRFNINQNDLDQFLGDKHESDQTVVQAFPAGASLSIDNPRGDVTVSGTSDDNQIHIAVHKSIYTRSDSEANKRAEQLSPSLTTENNTVMLTMPQLAGARADLTITIPPSVPVIISANHGDVRANSLKSSVTATANHGDIDFSAITGAATAHINNGDSSFAAHSVGGPVTLAGRGQDITLSDLSGPVTIRGEYYGDCHLEHVRGPVRFHTSRTDLQLVRLDGEVDMSPNAALSINDVLGPLTLSTGNRNISLDRVAGSVSVTNRNGSVDITSAPPLGNITVENRNGTVGVTVPENAGFNVDATTINGDIENDFSLPVQGPESRKSITGTVGKGGAIIRISTSQGDISLKKANVLPLPPAPPRPPKISIDEGPGGLRITSGPGGAIIINQDGLHITKSADGSSVYMGKGIQLTTTGDGGVIYIGRDGTHYTSNPDGSKNYVAKDGTQISISSTGGREATDSAGKPLTNAQIDEHLRKAEAEVKQAAAQRDNAIRKYDAKQNR